MCGPGMQSVVGIDWTLATGRVATSSAGAANYHPSWNWRRQTTGREHFRPGGGKKNNKLISLRRKINAQDWPLSSWLEAGASSRAAQLLSVQAAPRRAGHCFWFWARWEAPMAVEICHWPLAPVEPVGARNRAPRSGRRIFHDRSAFCPPPADSCSWAPNQTSDQARIVRGRKRTTNEPARKL